MKIINISFADASAAAYTLSHAINKCSEHQAMNLRGTDNYLTYPTLASMRDFTEEACREMLYDADAIVFHSTVKQFLQGLNLDPQKLESKKKLVYFHGSELRSFGNSLIKQIDECLDNYTKLVSTPDLLEFAPDAHWMPVCRSFSEIRRKYSLCNQDRQALKTFGVHKRVVNFAHAPTSEAKKGSPIFYRTVTKLVKANPDICYTSIKGQPWDACLRKMSNVDVFLDQALIGSYGAAAVEASIFKIPVVCKISSDVGQHIKTETGLDSPFITFSDEDDLTAKLYLLAERPKLRRMFGLNVYRFCKAIHDDKPVAERFLKLAGLT
jgi:hypothetical protein